MEGEFRTVLRGLSAANLLRRYQLVRAVRQAYKIGRTLTEQEAYAHLLPHIEAMFRELRVVDRAGLRDLFR